MYVLLLQYIYFADTGVGLYLCILLFQACSTSLVWLSSLTTSSTRCSLSTRSRRTSGPLACTSPSATAATPYPFSRRSDRCVTYNVVFVAFGAWSRCDVTWTKCGFKLLIMLVTFWRHYLKMRVCVEYSGTYSPLLFLLKFNIVYLRGSFNMYV